LFKASFALVMPFTFALEITILLAVMAVLVLRRFV